MNKTILTKKVQFKKVTKNITDKTRNRNLRSRSRRLNPGLLRGGKISVESGVTKKDTKFRRTIFSAISEYGV